MKNLVKFMSCLVVMVVLSLSAFAATAEVSKNLNNINKNINTVNKSEKDLQKNMKDVMADFKQNKIKSLTLVCNAKAKNSDWLTCLVAAAEFLAALKATEKFCSNMNIKCIGAVYTLIETANDVIAECGPLFASNNVQHKKVAEEAVAEVKNLQQYLFGFKSAIELIKAS